MRFMVIVKASKESEGGVMPDEQLLAAMGKYNEELAKAGVLLELSGLKPSSQGKRVRSPRRRSSSQGSGSSRRSRSRSASSG
jgi:hypothetical protein